MKSLSDEALVEACLRGDQTAWTALVARYKNLVYSVTVRYRLTPEDAADVFQAVWLDLFAEMERLRNPGAIRGWLMTVGARKSFEIKSRKAARNESADPEADFEKLSGPSLSHEWQRQTETEQELRLAIGELPTRCQSMIRMLFYDDPPLPYAEVAGMLGLAEGSIGFIRGRCLEKLRKLLRSAGF